MKLETSLYLDVLRFGAALLVVMAHVSTRAISGGFMWQMTTLGALGVVVFFVLSGYVIAFVTDGREREPRSYAAARLGRLYSVVVPSFVLAIGLDTVRRHLFPDFQLTGPDWLEDFGWRIGVGLLFVNDLWTLHVLEGTSGVYWSLSYEVAYYVMFGMMLFMRGSARVAALLCLALVVGPRIVALAPGWLFGVVAHRLSRRQVLGPKWQGVCLIASTAALAAAVTGLFRWGILSPDNSHAGAMFLYSPAQLLQANALAAVIAVHLFCVSQAPGRLRWLTVARRPIQAAAACTFGLYLFHQPVLAFAAAAMGRQDGSAPAGLGLLGITLAVSMSLAWMVEPTKRHWQQHIWRTLRPLSARAPGATAA